MKLVMKFFVLALSVMQCTACNKDVASSSASLPVTASSIAGSFTIASFSGTTNQTSIFTGYTFTFNENGTIVAAKGSDTFNGIWKFDDGNNTELKLTFTDAPLTELNNGWHIEELTDVHLLLTDDKTNEDNNDDHTSGNTLELERQQ